MNSDRPSTDSSELLPFPDGPHEMGEHAAHANGSRLTAGLPLGGADLLQLLKRQWWVVACTVLLSVGGAVGYWYYTPPTFESEAQLLIMAKDSRLATAGVSGRGDSGTVSENALATHMQILQGRKNVEQALKDAGLYDLKSIQDELDHDENETPTSFVIDRLDVTRGGAGQAKQANVLNISFRHSSPEETRLIIDAILNQYHKFVSDKFEDVNEEAAELISEAQLDLEKELKAAEQEHLEMRRSAPLMWDGEEGGNIHLTTYQDIQTELGSLDIKSAETESRLQIVNDALKANPGARHSMIQILALIDDASLSRFSIVAEVFGQEIQVDLLRQTPLVTQATKAEAERLVQLVAREKSLRRDFGPNHEEVAAVRDQINLIRKYLDAQKTMLALTKPDQGQMTPTAIFDAYVSLLTHDMSAIKQRKKHLIALAETEETAARSMVEFEMQDDTLKTQVSRKQDLYDAVVNRLRNINLAKDYGGFINEIIASPEPGTEVWPNLPICLALSLFLGIAAGGGIAMVLDLMDRSFHSPEDVGQTLSLPVLAMVPSLKPRPKEQWALIEGSKVDSTVCAFHAPGSTQAEVFRGLRTHLLFASQDQPMRIISVTSPKPGDGKSTVTANLAFSMAQAGRTVLLVDCDMRKPRMDKLIGGELTPGLSEVLRDKHDPWASMQTFEELGVSFLPAGTVSDSPAELLQSRPFGEFLEAAKERFDVVILDCPPVLRVTDPRIVASQVDSTLLAIRVAQDTKQEARFARDLLVQNGATLVGLVLNCWDRTGRFDTQEGYGYGDYKDGYTEEPGTRAA
jgi:succinoglycan biosynthesis transport protein ExoP